MNEDFLVENIQYILLDIVSNHLEKDKELKRISNKLKEIDLDNISDKINSCEVFDIDYIKSNYIINRNDIDLDFNMYVILLTSIKGKKYGIKITLELIGKAKILDFKRYNIEEIEKIEDMTLEEILNCENKMIKILSLDYDNIEYDNLEAVF